MVTFKEALHYLRYWFDERHIPTENLTLILNFQDADAAARFDICARREFGAMMLLPEDGKFDLTSFAMNGIEIRVESPLHAEPKR